ERYVISRYRTPDVNWRPQFLRILQQAGLKPWERLFQNLRSSRQTELVNEGHPIHAVCAWIGNSVKIAADHYLQVRDEDFDRAALALHGTACKAGNGDATSLVSGQKSRELPSHASTCNNRGHRLGLVPAPPSYALGEKIMKHGSWLGFNRL